MLEIEVQEAVLGITVLKCSGKIAMGPESTEIQVLVRKLLGENRKELVFDLSGNYIDSAGTAGSRGAAAAAEALSDDQTRQNPELLSTVEDACRDFPLTESGG